MQIAIQHGAERRTPPNFATASKIPARRSIIEKLVAEYIETHRACDAAFSAMSDAETTAANVRVPAGIRATTANKRDVGDYSKRGTRCPIRAFEIENAIKRVKDNTCKREDLPGGLMRLTTSRDFSAKNRVSFPLTPAQEKQIARLEAMLPIAVRYEADYKASMKAHRCDELRLKAEGLSDRLSPIMKKVARLKSKTLADVLAKCRLYEFDHELDASAEVALSITRDMQRLHAEGITCLCGLGL